MRYLVTVLNSAQQNTLFLIAIGAQLSFMFHYILCIECVFRQFRLRSLRGARSRPYIVKKKRHFTRILLQHPRHYIVIYVHATKMDKM